MNPGYLGGMSQPTLARPETTAGNPSPQPLSPRWALAALALSMLLAALGTSIANVALPTLAQAFGASFQAVQWVVLAYLLTVTSLIVGAGRLGDLLGSRRLLLAGIVLFTVASSLCGVAPTLGFLIAGRAVQGLGAAILMTLSLAFVGEVTPQEKLGRAMGLLGAMSAIGTALGPALGGVLVAGPGWRSIFFLQVPLGALAWLLARRHLPRTAPATGADRAGLDVPGTLLLALALAAYALAMTRGRGSFGALNLALLLGALGLAGLFVRIEARSPSPLLRLALFRDRTLRASLVASALVATVIMATMVVGPFYLSRTLRLGTEIVGLVLAVGPLVAALTAVPAGHLADRFGAQRLTSAGLIAMATGSGLLSLLPVRLGIPGYVAPIVVVTAGYALFQTANNTAVMADRRADQRGVVSGLLNLSRNLGLITGASAMGALFAWAATAQDLAAASPAEVARGMRVTFAVAAALIGLALLFTARGTLSRARVSAALAWRRPLRPMTAPEPVFFAGAAKPASRPARQPEQENTMHRKASLLGISLLLAGALAASAQDKKPLSPAGTAATMVGGTWSAPDKDGERSYSGGKWIEVAYSRPILRGRTEIFGKGADYGKVVNGGAPVWRAGANQTTKLTTEVALTIGGKRIEPGSYDLFVDLKEGAWTLILSTQPTQDRYDPKEKTKIWGSYDYDAKFDVVRVPMTMVTPALTIDQFTIEFVDMSDAGGKLALGWEKTGAVVPFAIAK